MQEKWDNGEFEDISEKIQEVLDEVGDDDPEEAAEAVQKYLTPLESVPASEEEKQKVNIKRLRLLIGGLSVIIAPLCFIPNDENDVSLGLTITGIIVVLTIIVLVLANTWAKKK